MTHLRQIEMDLSGWLIYTDKLPLRYLTLASLIRNCEFSATDSIPEVMAEAKTPVDRRLTTAAVQKGVDEWTLPLGRV